MTITSIAAAALMATSTASAAPMTLSWQGRLLDAAGGPLDGPHTIEVRLWNSAIDISPANLVHDETFSTDVDGGFVSVRLGADGDLDSSAFAAGELWVEVVVDDGVVGGRQPFANVGRAAYADHARTADSATSAERADVATTAERADTATNADALGGQAPSAFAPAAHSHGRGTCRWSCVDTPGTLTCPSGRYMAGISFPQLAGGTAARPPQTCSSSTNSDDVAVYCCTVQ